MAAMKLSNKRVRDLQRAFHLAGGLLVMAYIYSPLGELAAFSVLVRGVVVPVLLATGMAMWQAPRLRRLLARTQPGTRRQARGIRKPASSATHPTD